MNGPEEHDPEQDPAFDPEEQARVRALLADLGSGGSHPPGPVPDDVVARLDATLADLGASSRDTAPSPRRRRGRQLLVAAAVAAVLGVGGVTAAGLVSRSQEGASSTSAGGSSADSSAESGAGGSAESIAPPELTRAGFADEAAAVAYGTPAPQQDGRTTLTAGCATPPGRGELTAVLLDGEAAVLVARPARDGRQLLQAWSCDASRVLASTRVPVPPS